MKKYKYQKTWTKPDGKRAIVRADDKQELWEKYYKKRYGLEGIRQELPFSTLCQILDVKRKATPGEMSVSEWARKAVESWKKGSVSEAYYYNYCKAMEKHILAQIGPVALKEITEEDCQKILDQHKGMSQNHINQVYQILRFIFETAYRKKQINDDPTKDLQKPKAKPKQRRRALTDKETEVLKELFDKFPEEFRVFKIMYYTGARPSEIWRMQRRDIVDVDGERMIKIKGSKSESAPRFVPLPDAIFCDISDFPEDSYLVTSEAGNPMNKTIYKRRSNRLKREMDIALGASVYRNKIVDSKLGDFVPYDLRHDYCTRLAFEGVPLDVAQYLMGHSSVTVTADIYNHVSAKTVARNMQQILKGVTGV